MYVHTNADVLMQISVYKSSLLFIFEPFKPVNIRKAWWAYIGVKLVFVKQFYLTFLQKSLGKTDVLVKIA